MSTLIFAMLMTGLANLFIAGKRYVLHAKSRMSGGELGKYFVDPLHMQVRQDTWDDAANNNLSEGTRSFGCQTIENINYTGNYTVSNVTGVSARRVNLNITWNESIP